MDEGRAPERRGKAELLKPDLGPMYVTPHDIDERVDFLSYTISEAIHGALFYNK